jgi:carbamoyltransferase
MGEWASTSIARGGPEGIETLAQIRFPHSLGLLYAAFTFHCGFKVNSGEYKLMGLAPFGTPRFAQRIFDQLVDLREDGSFRLDTRCFGFLTENVATGAEFERLFGPRREPEARITREHRDLAASAQAVLEEAMLRLARRALAVARSRNLCLAGGVALNCVANARLKREVAGLEGIWIQPASGDAGGALGAALEVAHRVFGAKRHDGVARGADGQRGSLLGPAFDDAAIGAALDAAGLAFHALPDAAARDETVARALADGMVVGRFDGKMEFGPRALGSRSILADPRREDGQLHINRKVKFRESWRPFAPAVLAEHAAALFEIEGESPYMLLTAPVRAALRLGDGEAEVDEEDLVAAILRPRSVLPAITHVDFSARLQTVDAARNPGFHALLARFHTLTGCPVLVNTSFNLRGEPIVGSPEDAVRCFLPALGPRPAGDRRLPCLEARAAGSPEGAGGDGAP